MPYFDKAISLCPHDPQRWAFCAYRSLAHIFAGEDQQALEWAERALHVPNCHYWPYAHRVAALGHLQRAAELPRALAELQSAKAGLLLLARAQATLLREGSETRGALHRGTRAGGLGGTDSRRRAQVGRWASIGR